MESNGINTRSACFMCSKLEDTEEYQMHECPIYVMHMDNVHLESRKVCV